MNANVMESLRQVIDFVNITTSLCPGKCTLNRETPFSVTGTTIRAWPENPHKHFSCYSHFSSDVIAIRNSTRTTAIWESTPMMAIWDSALMVAILYTYVGGYTVYICKIGLM